MDGSGSPPVKASTVNPALTSGRANALEQAGLVEDRIGDDQAPLPPSCGNVAELPDGVAAEERSDWAV